MKRAWLLPVLSAGWLVAQDLPPGLPPGIASPKAAIPTPASAEPTTPAMAPPSEPGGSAAVAIPARIPVEHYQTLWQRSPFELSIQSANAAPTGIAADWLLTSLSRVNGQPMAILFNRASNETAVVKTTDNGKHGMRLISAEIMPDYRKSKVTVSRGSDSATLVFQEQDLASLALPGAVNPAPGMPNPGAQPRVNAPPLPGAATIQSGHPGAGNPNATPRPPRRMIIRPKPVSLPPSP